MVASGIIFTPLFFLLLLIFLAAGIKLVDQYERMVVLRLGKFAGVKEPGLRFIIPIIDRGIRVDIRTRAMDITPQEVITRDNVPVKVDAVVYFRVVDPAKAVLEVENAVRTTGLLSQTTLRSVTGQMELDELLAKREEVNQRLQEIIDRETDPWGIKVSGVEIKGIELPEDMKRAMAKQAEAERERRAKIISAEGEAQAAEKLAHAASVIASQPSAIQLRYLQTLVEIAAEKNSTILFPLPLEVLKAFLPREAKE